MALRDDDLVRLGPAARRQIMEKLAGQEAATPAKGSKYRNVKAKRGGISFDSQKEARRYDELMALWLNGDIRDLRLQQNFTIVEGYTTPDGERVRPSVYKADFVYWAQRDGAWVKVVEDAKGYRTETYRTKKKLVEDRFRVRIEEV